jgi:RNA-directed DNA polymerase
LFKKGDDIDSQELNFVSSLFHDVTHENKRNLITIMPSNILHAYYHLHVVPKQRGGVRYIYEPNKTLKTIQKRINKKILKEIPVSDYAFAYVPGRSIVQNAKPHIRNPLLLKLDIYHFFDSIHFRAIFDIFKEMGHSMEFSRLLAGLVTIDDHLPQGAPTSPALSNIYLKTFDEEIGDYCKKNDITYTRYSDDLTFSMQQFDADLVKTVREKLEALGLELNRKKSKVISGPLQKRVTGIVVNEKLQASISYRRKIRQEMYYISKFGLRKHLERIKVSDEETYIASLLGRVNYVLQINQNDKEFKKYKEILSTPSLGNLRSQLKDLLD